MTATVIFVLEGHLRSMFYRFLFSAHISYGKGKYSNQTGFFYKICQELISPKPNLTLWVLPIEFNSHKFSLVRNVFVENSGLF